MISWFHNFKIFFSFFFNCIKNCFESFPKAYCISSRLVESSLIFSFSLAISRSLEKSFSSAPESTSFCSSFWNDNIFETFAFFAVKMVKIRCSVFIIFNLPAVFEFLAAGRNRAADCAPEFPQSSFSKSRCATKRGRDSAVRAALWAWRRSSWRRRTETQWWGRARAGACACIARPARWSPKRWSCRNLQSRIATLTFHLFYNLPGIK